MRSLWSHEEKLGDRMRKLSEEDDDGCALPETLPSSHVSALDSERERRVLSVETGHPLLWN